MNKRYEHIVVKKLFICNPPIEGDLVEEEMDVAVEATDDPTLCDGHFQANYLSKKANSNQAETTQMHEQHDNDQGLLFLTLNVQESGTKRNMVS
ncbi:hypothetical protein E5676_scaffold522G00760 [Cucumis melo var. makuwa]|uniref:Uncharacterized protein n=1 Tax=Cucumis melo var. makuwa TaxID=1194695 RepID=A0A5D3D6G4_CUCMM|nr:hypothetical protein E6C27_scaffold190G001240 [Cucumis melo var. makuwa]TYK19151.1 hypothetical protein E5676_scaffold522G00760 [Cucumis melo var. makuwa]